MIKDDTNLLFQGGIYNENGELNIDNLNFLISINEYLIIKVLKNEFDFKEILSTVPIEDIYIMGKYALKKAILKFDKERDTISGYYYDQLTIYFSNKLYPIEDFNNNLNLDEEIKDLEKFNLLKDKEDITSDSNIKEVLKIILNKEDYLFIENLYNNKYTSKQLKKIMSVHDNKIDKILNAIIDEIENDHYENDKI